jgi:hypothetical protein
MHANGSIRKDYYEIGMYCIVLYYGHGVLTKQYILQNLRGYHYKAGHLPTIHFYPTQKAFYRIVIKLINAKVIFTRLILNIN